MSKRSRCGERSRKEEKEKNTLKGGKQELNYIPMIRKMTSMTFSDGSTIYHSFESLSKNYSYLDFDLSLDMIGLLKFS